MLKEVKKNAITDLDEDPFDADFNFVMLDEIFLCSKCKKNIAKEDLKVYFVSKFNESGWLQR
jgi:hypothetical protein